jgi:hypothetical protein
VPNGTGLVFLCLIVNDFNCGLTESAFYEEDPISGLTLNYIADFLLFLHFLDPTSMFLPNRE